MNPVTEERIQKAMSQGDRVVLAIRKKLENKKFNIAWKRNGVVLISPFGVPVFSKENHFTRAVVREQEVEASNLNNSYDWERLAKEIGIKKELIHNPLSYSDMKLVMKRFAMYKSKVAMAYRTRKGVEEVEIVNKTSKEEKFKMNPLIRLSRRERSQDLINIGDLVFMDEDAKMTSTMRNKGKRSRTRDRRRRF